MCHCEQVTLSILKIYQVGVNLTTLHSLPIKYLSSAGKEVAKANISQFVESANHMGFGPKQWECKDCGRRHRNDRKQCVECGYTVLRPVDNAKRAGKLTNALLAILPALLALLTMGLIAWAMFF
jgi:ribosomal protein L37E